MKHALATAILVATTIGLSDLANSAEIKVLSPAALRSSMNEIIPKFEAQSGHKVTIEFGPAGALAQRVKAGDPVDIAILTEEQIESLQSEGRIAKAGKIKIGRVGMGVFVRKGDTRYDVSSVQAFQKSLLAAPSIGHNDPTSGAPSGIFAAQLLARLDIAPEIRSKIKVFPASNAPIYAAIAAGEVAIGLGQITEIRAQPNVDLLGPLPDVIQNYTSFAAAITSAAKEPNASKAFIDFVTSPPSAEIMKSKGLTL